MKKAIVLFMLIAVMGLGGCAGYYYDRDRDYRGYDHRHDYGHHDRDYDDHEQEHEYHK